MKYSLISLSDYQDEEEEEDNYVGCARSDPNEPVSEKPLYDYLWPKEIEEEDDKVLIPSFLQSCENANGNCQKRDHFNFLQKRNIFS